MPKTSSALLSIILALFLPRTVLSEKPPNDETFGPDGPRITQDQIVSGNLSLNQLRRAGLAIFATPFNHAHGYGDGPQNPAGATTPGGRPTLQGNGTFLRVNGLDAQTCVECHNLVSTDTVPTIFGIGGAGGMSASVMFMPRVIDVADDLLRGEASFDGRLINSNSLFGSGGVQAIGQEMTADLQALKSTVLENPGQTIRLSSKGVYFGEISADNHDQLDTSGVQGIDADLVVRPFGRKGQFATLRQFSQGAMMFHMGMQPVEIFGPGIDDDGDGVTDEVLVGEMSTLEIFVATQDTPVQLRARRAARKGIASFHAAGCSDCHRPMMTTEKPWLEFSFPVVDDAPSANVYYQVDLRRGPMGFKPSSGGVEVPMFSDLKRHDMGPDLAEDFSAASDQQNREYITAKLWGVADTAPYMHDGRALTLEEAIASHGGDAEWARDRFLSMDESGREELIAFLKTLRNPSRPNADIVH
ncbi:MAG: hypothetical protein IH835_03690 [Proteobacteria bacterium]|nr:hypothetical protein [Pseudomonadota bacterium]